MKLKSILEDIEILKPRRSKEERWKNRIVVIQKEIQKYIKDGCVGDLDLEGTPIEKLPDNLKKVGGDLYLDGTKIKFLPDDLVVDENLWLNNTPIETLPRNLKVGRYLNLGFTKIESLPNDLVVGGSLILNNTLITAKYSREEIKKMAPKVNDIYIYY